MCPCDRSVGESPSTSLPANTLWRFRIPPIISEGWHLFLFWGEAASRLVFSSSALHTELCLYVCVCMRTHPDNKCMFVKLRPISIADVMEPASGVRNLTWRHPTVRMPVLCVYVCVCTCAYTHVCLCVCMHLCACVCVSETCLDGIQLCADQCVCFVVDVCMCVYIYTYHHLKLMHMYLYTNTHDTHSGLGAAHIPSSGRCIAERRPWFLVV